MNDKTRKITVTLPLLTIELADENWEEHGFSSRSEYINSAIIMFATKEKTDIYMKQLAKTYHRIEKNEVKNLEDRMAKIAFKLAVEMAQIYVMLCSIFDLSKHDTKQIRKKAYNLVNRSKGFVPIISAMKEAFEMESLYFDSDLDIELATPFDSEDRNKLYEDY